MVVQRVFATSVPMHSGNSIFMMVFYSCDSSYQPCSCMWTRTLVGCCPLDRFCTETLVASLRFASPPRGKSTKDRETPLCLSWSLEIGRHRDCWPRWSHTPPLPRSSLLNTHARGPTPKRWCFACPYQWSHSPQMWIPGLYPFVPSFSNKGEVKNSDADVM